MAHRRRNEFAVPASTDPNNSRWQLKFECYVPYEVASVGNDSYKIQVPTQMMGTVPFTIPAANGIPARTIRAPDVGTTATRVDQLGREFCARLNASLKIVGGGFDMGPDFRVIFKCVRPQQGSPGGYGDMSAAFARVCARESDSLNAALARGIDAPR